MHLHRLIITFLLCAALPVMAESEQPKQSKKLKHPDNLIPLPEIPEPEPIEQGDIQAESDQVPEAEVTIIRRGQDIIEEHRVNGELLMIKVIPRIGPPYYLKKNMIRDYHNHPNEVGIDVSPPMWQLLKF